MALPLEKDAAHDTRIARISRSEQHEALSLLLTGKIGSSSHAVDQFLSFAASQRLSIDRLWGCWRGEQLWAVAMLLPCAGKTAMVFCSPVSDDPEPVSQVVEAVCQSASPGKVHLIQALVEPAAAAQIQALEGAGFFTLAELINMKRATTAEFPALSLPEDFNVIQWKPQHRPQFAQAILASYEQTADCPKLVGLRDIDDIIDGHMATGQFKPDQWFCILQHQQPAGVMLLNNIPEQRSLELVYLGLAPSARGKGLAQLLLKHALGLGHRQALDSMSLAVDASNKPAIRLYDRLGFSSVNRRLALVRSMR